MISGTLLPGQQDVKKMPNLNEMVFMIVPLEIDQAATYIQSRKRL
ncbi:hypothetical protein ALO95_101903 [Pseudomonas syringae pv. antirrhini]|uniref:Uncharacterized protein n=1 Tax=Pseudomonas syringae pv. antirrhini TaxID=251702 RepID=A0A0P9K5A7_9PSED|nr:hypothetical protein ALO87_102073 [Pseudomonas syringae pv. apii]KPW50513.1 hypothetical protein ALO88_102275 [Pseudomonas syringae pv. antirrhini]RMP30493.1 hypothetical protein ALQ24_102365 [Pseudomonas syringae pv. antirrhini]RMP44623.1 hypothetical protein ALQ23_102074 [Pseudomonas syringae pv. antirrhini]RMW30635.1 hypothetical protein ALO95_101903 [Pseudomonas syringae pv. antirrhini]